MKIEIVMITPKMAADMLKMNTRNRPLSKGRVTTIKRAIENGEWKLNGDAIRFSTTGVLLDGQTRLSAIVESDRAVESLVVTGLPDDVFGTIDINGSARTAADVLAIKKIPNYKLVASIAASVLIWERTKTSSVGVGSEKKPTTTEIEKRGSEDHLVIESASFVAGNAFILRSIGNKTAGYFRYSTMRDDPAMSNLFFEGLLTGVDLSKNSPILLLRDVLVKNSISLRKVEPVVVIAWLFYAYDLFKTGRNIKLLKITTDGVNKNVHKFQGLDY